MSPEDEDYGHGGSMPVRYCACGAKTFAGASACESCGDEFQILRQPRSRYNRGEVVAKEVFQYEQGVSRFGRPTLTVDLRGEGELPEALWFGLSRLATAAWFDSTDGVAFEFLAKNLAAAEAVLQEAKYTKRA